MPPPPISYVSLCTMHRYAEALLVCRDHRVFTLGRSLPRDAEDTTPHYTGFIARRVECVTPRVRPPCIMSHPPPPPRAMTTPPDIRYDQLATEVELDDAGRGIREAPRDPLQPVAT